MQRKKWISLLLVMALLFSSSVTVAATKPDTEVTRVQEVTSLRETDSETYLMSDGTYQCVVYAGDKYYEDSTGSLQLIDNSIKLDAATALSAEKQYVNTANAFDVSFTEGSTPQISIGLEGKSVTFSPLSATGGNSNIISTQKIDLSLGKVNTCDILNELACTGSNTVTYSDVFYNTDLVYVLDNAALKEYIILENENAPNAFSFLFSMDGLTMRTGEDTAAFRDTAGKDVFALDSLFAIDSNGAQTEALTYTFTPFKDTGKMIVTVTLDPEYLAAADRAFPVVIDPTITVSSAQTADTFISEAYPNNNYYLSEYLRTGKDTTYGVRRTYIKFNIPSSVPQYSVISATLDMERTSGVAPTTKAYRCQYSWSSSTITWANARDALVNGSPVSFPYSSANIWYSINVSTIVKQWVNEGLPNYGFVLADQTESSTSHWTTFYSSDAVSPHKPELLITYGNPDFIYTHYYDSTFSGKIYLLPTVVNNVSAAFDRQFNIEFVNNGSAIYDTSLIPAHKDIVEVSNRLYAYSRQSNEKKVFWTDYPTTPTPTYCNHEKNSCVPIAAIAGVYQNRPVIHFMSFDEHNGSTSEYTVCMMLNLLHETAHTFGLDERYYIESHSGYGMQCVMESYPDNDTAASFYEKILRGENAFCATCEADLGNTLFN